MAAASVSGGAGAVDQPLPAKAAQEAAQIAGIEMQVAGELARRRPIAMRQLIKHPRLGQREPAL